MAIHGSIFHSSEISLEWLIACHIKGLADVAGVGKQAEQLYMFRSPVNGTHGHHISGQLVHLLSAFQGGSRKNGPGQTLQNSQYWTILFHLWFMLKKWGKLCQYIFTAKAFTYTC